MRVRATRPGYYNLVYRNVGDVFDLRAPEDFSDAHRTGKDVKPGWMEKVDNSIAKTPAPGEPLPGEMPPPPPRNKGGSVKPGGEVI